MTPINSHALKILFLTACLLATACATGAVAETEQIEPLPNAVNINTAAKEELATLPYIGEKIAERIIEHRSANGLFERPEQLMLIQGISDKRFRKIRRMVRVE